MTTRGTGYVARLIPDRCGFIVLDQEIDGLRRLYVSKLALARVGITRAGRSQRVAFDIEAERDRPGLYRAVKLTRLSSEAV
jgi:hypothetical protein